MKRRRVRSVGGVEVQRDPTCDLCKREAYLKSVSAGRRTLCIACAWHAVDGLRRIYSAPEITALERIRHRNERGTGFKAEADISPGWVYYIRVGDTIKIGYSQDVSQRMRTYPPNAELLAAHPGTLDTEKRIQRKFRDDLSRGREWFAPSDELMAHIDSVVAQFGDKSHLAYEFTRPKTQEEKVRALLTTRGLADIADGVHFAG